MKTVKIEEAYFQGHVSLEKTKGWIQPWRLPIDQKLLFPSPEEGCVERASRASGVRIRLKTNSPTLTLNLPSGAFAGGAFDLVIDNDVVQTVVLQQGTKSITFDKLPGKNAVVEIWLSPCVLVQVASLAVEDGKTCEPSPDKRKRWITYGSSITHCASAASPANIWAGVAARRMNLHLTSIGLGGHCHIDPMFARTIRDMPADLISLKLGINVHGCSSHNSRSFRPAIIGFVQTIRDKQPKTPIILISPVCCPDREDTPNSVGMTLSIMREEMMDAYKRLLKVTGEKNLYYIDGLKLADHVFAEKFMPDNLHPDGEGYIRMGENFLKAFPKPLKALFPITHKKA